MGATANARLRSSVACNTPRSSRRHTEGSDVGVDDLRHAVVCDDAPALHPIEKRDGRRNGCGAPGRNGVGLKLGILHEIGRRDGVGLISC